MKVTINKQVEAKLLKVDATVRYWQDSEINGAKDYDCEEEPNEPKMPCTAMLS